MAARACSRCHGGPFGSKCERRLQTVIFKDPRPGIEADATIPVGVNQQSQPERMDRQSVCWLGSHSTTARAVSKIRGARTG